MKEVNFSLVLLACILLYGCSFGAYTENMIYQGEEKTYDEILNNNVRIISVYGGEKTGPDGPPSISNTAFYDAVKESLTNQGLFSEDGKYQLEIFMAEIDRPNSGSDMTVATHIQYSLTDTINNSVIFDKIISASYTIAFEEAFSGSTRIRMANERSGKSNIEKLLDNLAKLKINKSRGQAR